MTTTEIQLFLQAFIALLFLGSFIIGVTNLLMFRKNHNASQLKSIMNDYLKMTAEEVFSNYIDDLAQWKTDLAESDVRPRKFYYDQLNNMSRIGHFYEHVGLLVKKRLLDFHLLFELLPFPYKFWEDTEEFRDIMQKLTYSDFWGHFSYLYTRYEAESRNREKPALKAQLLKKYFKSPSAVSGKN